MPYFKINFLFSILVWKENQECGEQYNNFEMVIKNEVNNSIFFSNIAKALLSYFWVHKPDFEINFLLSILVWKENQECGEQYNSFVEGEGGGWTAFTFTIWFVACSNFIGLRAIITDIAFFTFAGQHPIISTALFTFLSSVAGLTFAFLRFIFTSFFVCTNIITLTIRLRLDRRPIQFETFTTYTAVRMHPQSNLIVCRWI